MAIASRAATASLPGAPRVLVAIITSATATSTSSLPTAASSTRARSPEVPRLREPYSPAATRNPASADSDALSEKPGAPTRAKPVNTTFPVMLATNTRPSRKMLTASTRPVTTVSASSSGGQRPVPRIAQQPRPALRHIRRRLRLIGRRGSGHGAPPACFRTLPTISYPGADVVTAGTRFAYPLAGMPPGTARTGRAGRAPKRQHLARRAT
jgi:hypothetical protein